MYKVAVGAAVMTAALGVCAARAQGVRGRDAKLHALLARAESLQALVRRQDSIARRARYEDLRARRFETGSVTALLPNAVGDLTGRRIASGAAAYLDSLGAIPPQFLSSVVAIAYMAVGVDSALRAGGLAGRTRVMVDVKAEPDTFADGLQVASAMARTYVETLDPEWRAWLPTDLGLAWKRGREDAAAIRELAAGDTRAASECLGGKTAACRLWLGLDRDPDPYGARYAPSEIRVIIGRRMAMFLAPDAKHCLDGSDEACMRYARSGQVTPVPGMSSLRSVIRAVRALHGAEALRRALADTTGGVGARLARGAGIPEDSLVTEWRAWLLTGGGRPRVRASTREAVPVLLFGGLLVFAAARSGRWR